VTILDELSRPPTRTAKIRLATDTIIQPESRRTFAAQMRLRRYAGTARSDDSKHSKVRRWDQMATEAVTLVDGGIPIPARVATGNVEWPVDNNLPQSLPPHGVEPHYAVLGLLTRSREKNSLSDFRCEFSPLLSCIHERIESPQKIVAVRPTSDVPESAAEPAAPQKPSKRKKPAGTSMGATSTTEQPE
jgi:hypothetical protein